MKKVCVTFALLLFFVSYSLAQMNIQNLLVSTNLFPVKKDGMWGYINNSGELIIDAIYEQAHPFYEGLALVEQADDIWFINESGEQAFSTPFSMSRIVSEGIIRILLDEQVGYIESNGTIIIEPQFTQGGDFSEGLAWVRLESNNNVGFIDKNGEIAITPIFEYAGDFHDGYAPVRVDGSWGYIDKNGKLFKNLIYTLTNDFSEGIAPIWKYGPDLTYIDKKGEEIFRHRIYEPGNLPKGQWKVPVWGFHSGRVKAQNTNQLIGYLNNKGEVEIQFQFSDGGDFSDGLARVKSGSKWGYINKRGGMDIPAQFDDAGDFNNGVAPVYRSGTEEDFNEGKEGVMLGYINKKGILIWAYSK